MIEDGIGFSINGETFSKESVLLKLTRSNYIIQEVVAQNDKMSLLYPYSLNTIRLVTVRGLKDKKIHSISSLSEELEISERMIRQYKLELEQAGIYLKSFTPFFFASVGEK